MMSKCIFSVAFFIFLIYFSWSYLDLGIIVAGVVTGWAPALYIGYGEYLINLALCSLAYICLALCIGEMAGIIAFSGGSYGYCRCTLSPYWLPCWYV